MAFPIVKYNSSTGSNTAPSDAAGNGVLASGTGAATTITLGATVDLSDGVADDDSDFIYCSTTTGERHLFQITSFTGGTGACTAVVVAEAIGATTFTGATWHINGTRLSLDGDTSMTDWRTLDPGWIVELDGTFVQTSIGVDVSLNRSTTSTVTDEPVTIRASAGATSKPTIDIQSNGWGHYLAKANNYTTIRFENLNLYSTTGGGGMTYVYTGVGQIVLENCNVDNSGSTADYCIWGEYTQRALRLFNCHIKGGTTHSVYVNGLASLTMSNCWIDGQDAYGSTALVFAQVTGNATCTVVNTLITESTGDGLVIDMAGTSDSTAWVTNVTCADNAGDGFSMVSGVTTDVNSVQSVSFVNCLAVNNGAYGWSEPAGTEIVRKGGWIDYNCGYNNTSGNYETLTAGPNDITITADPFTDASTDDYTLNSAAAGGALLSSAAMASIPARPS